MLRIILSRRQLCERARTPTAEGKKYNEILRTYRAAGGALMMMLTTSVCMRRQQQNERNAPSVYFYITIISRRNIKVGP